MSNLCTSILGSLTKFIMYYPYMYGFAAGSAPLANSNRMLCGTIKEVRYGLMFNSYCILLTVHCILHTAYCSLYIVYCILLTVHCILHTAYCSLNISYCPLPTAHCLLPTAYCPLPTAHCPLPTAYCLLPTAHFPLPTAHCPLPTAYSTPLAGNHNEQYWFLFIRTLISSTPTKTAHPSRKYPR